MPGRVDLAYLFLHFLPNVRSAVIVSKQPSSGLHDPDHGGPGLLELAPQPPTILCGGSPCGGTGLIFSAILVGRDPSGSSAIVIIVLGFTVRRTGAASPSLIPG